MSETQETSLTTLPAKADIPALFDMAGGIENLCKQIETEALAIHQDYTTDKGRKAARSLASKVSKSKTVIEAVRKDLTADWREKTAKVNAIGKVATEKLDALRDKIKAPAEEAEAKEAERAKNHMLALDQFLIDKLTHQDSSAELKAHIAALEAIEVGPAWEEFEGEARMQKTQAIQSFQADLKLAEAREAQEQELADFRREKLEREEREAKEKAARDQEERDRADKERQEADRKAASERAQRDAEEKAARDKQEAEERHQRELQAAKDREVQAAENERLRLAEERRQQEAAEQRRKADAENRRRVRAEIVQAIAAMKPANWEECVDAMIAGEIPHVKVQF